MLQQEFEDITGLAVTEMEFETINRIYMTATNSISKYDFCKAYAKCRESEAIILVKDLATRVDRLKEAVEKHSDEVLEAQKAYDEACREKESYAKAATEENEEKNLLLVECTDLAMALIKNGLESEAIKVIGHKRVIAVKIALDMELNAGDLSFIASTFGRR